MSRLKPLFLAILIIAVLALLVPLSAFGDTGKNPSSPFFGLPSVVEGTNLNVNGLSPGIATSSNKIDVVFAFDRTSSMGDEIDVVKAKANYTLNEIRNRWADSWFGVASFMDYPASYNWPENGGYADTYGDATYGDVPYMVNQPVTADTAGVAAVINTLTLGNGRDWPE
ncbi:MAG: hypothetical protein MUP40_01740, partial [Actinobacteria bacterium]|nr:hypothetical protein [Actinomycetota bacterium]